MVRNQWYHFGVFGAPPILVYVSTNWDVHWGYDLGFDPWPKRTEHPFARSAFKARNFLHRGRQHA